MYTTSTLSFIALGIGQFKVKQVISDTDHDDPVFDSISTAVELTFLIKKIVAVSVANHGHIDDDDGSVTLHLEGLPTPFLFVFHGIDPKTKSTGLDRAKVFAESVLARL